MSDCDPANPDVPAAPHAVSAQTDGDAPAPETPSPSPAQVLPQRAARQLLAARVLRASPRVYLAPTHAEQLLGPGCRPTVLWPGVLGEGLCLERVSVCGAGRKVVKARVCAAPVPCTRVALTQAALLALDIRAAPAWGDGDGVGGALSGPKGAVVLADGVYRAATRLVVNTATAGRVGLVPGSSVSVRLALGGERVDTRVRVEVRDEARENWLVVDAETHDRLGDTSAPLALRVVPVGEDP